jgi:hypothetical protein
MANSTRKKTRKAPAMKAAGRLSQREIEIRERALRDDKFSLAPADRAGAAPALLRQCHP